MKTLCHLPSAHLHISKKGLSPCCRATPLSSIEDSRPGFFSTTAFADLKKQIHSGQKADACSSCWSDEENGRISLRQRFGSKLPSIMEYDVWPHQGPVLVEIFLDRICPLACRMCNSKNSTSWDFVFKELLNYKNEFSPEAWTELESRNNGVAKVSPDNLLTRHPKFKAILSESLKYARTVNFTGGEPLSHPDHLNLLDYLLKSGVSSLSYFTSLNIPQKNLQKILVKWKNFSKVFLNVSADHIFQDYEKFRLGGKFSLVLDNILYLKQQNQNKEQFNIIIPIIVQAFNIMDIDRIIQFWRSKSISNIQLKSLTGPNFLSSTVIPIKKRDKIISMLESLIHTNCQPQITNTLKSELGLLSQVDDSRLYPDYQLFNKILDKMYHSNFFNFK